MAAVDRLSELPHDIIIHILSLVLNLHVVPMSILSKYWRHMWGSVPTLYFYVSKSIGLKPCDRLRFWKFVSESLDCRNKDKIHVTHVTKFKLDIKCHYLELAP